MWGRCSYTQPIHCVYLNRSQNKAITKNVISAVVNVENEVPAGRKNYAPPMFHQQDCCTESHKEFMSSHGLCNLL